MKPCPAAAAATLLDLLAAGRGHRGEAAAALERVPVTHPMRRYPDAVLDFARRVRSGGEDTYPSPEEIREHAAAIREGAPEMRATGWWPTLHGGVE